MTLDSTDGHFFNITLNSTEGHSTLRSMQGMSRIGQPLALGVLKIEEPSPLKIQQ